MLANTLQVGDFINSPQDLDALPPGTIFGPTGVPTEQYVKVARDHFRRHDVDHSEAHTNRYYVRRLGTANFETSGYYQVRSYPEGYVPDPEPESLGAYRWRFRQHMLWAQSRHGVAVTATMTGLRALGCGDDSLPVGADLAVYCQRDLNRLPVGSIVYTGDPLDVERYGVWTLDADRQWCLVLGDGTRPDAAVAHGVVTVAVPDASGEMVYDPPQWASSVTDEDVAQFKAKAWLVGMKTKHAAGWCGTLEQVLAGMGVTADSLRSLQIADHHVGDTVTSTVAAALPVGTVLSHRTDEQVFFYQRVDDAPVRAGTRQKMAFRLDSDEPLTSRSHFAAHMRIESLPWQDPALAEYTLPFAADLWRPQAFAALPVGSLVIYAEANYYLKCHDGRLISTSTEPNQVVPLAGTYSVPDFNLTSRNESMKVVRFG